ncbi:MAG: cation:dicarboxylase symporter family transporter, partial [Prochlorococcus sp.]
MLLGLAAGLLLPHSIVSLLAPIGDGFLRLFQMPVLPFLSLSLIAGVGRLNMDQAGRLLLRAASVLMGFWAVVLLAVLLMPLGFPNW